jgi:hypothetical protein
MPKRTSSPQKHKLPASSFFMAQWKGYIASTGEILMKCSEGFHPNELLDLRGRETMKTKCE